MADSLLDEILTNLCSFRDYFLAAMGLLGVLLLLTIAGFAVIPPDTGAYVVNVLNAIGLSALIGIIGVISVYCYRRH